MTENDNKKNARKKFVHIVCEITCWKDRKNLAKVAKFHKFNVGSSRLLSFNTKGTVNVVSSHPSYEKSHVPIYKGTSWNRYLFIK